MTKRSLKSFNIAYCGIITALSVVIMSAALIPSFTYLFPAISGIFIWTVSEQLNRKWGLLSYAASALLCFITVPELEADLYYLFFFGYFPLIKEPLERRLLKPLAFFAKLAVFNISVVAVFFILSKIMNIDQILEGLEGFGDMAVYVLWITANIAFIFYDFSLGNVFYAFRRWIKPKINKKLKLN